LSLGEELRRNTLWVLAGDAGSRLVSLAFGIVLARLLVPEDFGLVVTVQILTGALAFVAAHGTGDALVRARSMSERDIGTVFAIQIVTCLALMGLLFAIAGPFSAWYRPRDQR
jgi:O-antigen/teichoic acid export membrane protein